MNPERPRILVLDSLASEGLAVLEEAGLSYGVDVEDPHAILLRSTDLHGRDFGASLLAVARAGTGVNNIPVDALTARGVPVFYAPGANADAVAELVLAGLFLAARNIPEALDFARSLEGDDRELHESTEAGKKRFAGYELRGRTLGVVGLGAIGVRVANAGCALGMHVLGYDPALSVENALRLDRQVVQAGSLESLLSGSDAVTLHVPLTDSTRGMLGSERLARMRPGSVLLNFARAEIVDVDALSTALNGGMRAYVSDFPMARLQGHPRTVTLPHLGASTAEAQRNCAVQVAEALRAFLLHGEIRRAVNFPEIQLPREGAGSRIALAHDNVPGILQSISQCIAERGLNIAEMLNRARGDIAYTLLDLEEELPEEALNKLRGIPGMRHGRGFSAARDPSR